MRLKIFGILRLFLFLVLVNGLCVSTFAESNRTCIVNIPIVVIDKSGNIPKNATVEIEVVPSNGTTKVFTLKHSNESTKIPIEFNTPGNYHYTVKQKSCSNSNVKLDATIYTINILIDDNGKELVSAISISKTEKTDIVKFENVLLDDTSDTTTSTTEPTTEPDDDYTPPITTDDDITNTEDIMTNTPNTEPDINYDTETTTNNNNVGHDTNPGTGVGISSGLLIVYVILVLITIIFKNRKDNVNGN